MKLIFLFLFTFGTVLLNASISYLEDVNSSYTPQTILDKNDFILLEKDNFNKGITRSTYWLKVSLQNNSNKEILKVLNFPYPLMDEIILYDLVNNKLIESAKVGNLISKENAKTLEPSLSFHINLKENTLNIFYLRVRAEGPLNLNYNIYSLEEFSNYKLESFSSIAFYVGAVLILLLYNFVLYLFIRIRSSLYYIMFHIVLLLFVLDANGYLVLFMYPGHPEWGRLTITLLLSIAVFLQLLFAYEFLEIKKYGRISKKITYIVGVILLLLIVSNFSLPFTEHLQLVNLVSIFVHIFTLSTAVLYLIKFKTKNSKYYTFAWTIFVLSNIIEHMSVQGLIDVRFLILRPMQVGVLVEMLLISIALASRFNTINSKNKKLSLMVNTDSLTQIKNRHYFFEQANHLLSHLKRKEDSYALVMLDIDYFKSVNDNFGHAIGDKVLIEFTSQISKILREDDIFARIGGEEFVLLIQSNQKEAELFTERVRELTESITIDSSKGDVKFTISLGVTIFNNTTLSVDDILSNADTALYKAKRNGRNCIEFF